MRPVGTRMGRTEALRQGWLVGWKGAVPVPQLPVPSVPSVLLAVVWAFIKVIG